MTSHVICMDGTWNDPQQTDIDPLSEQECLAFTNVFKVFHGLTGISPDSRTPYRQQGSIFGSAGDAAIYFNGVGTEIGTRLLGGAAGWGVDERIKDAYHFLTDAYQDGDTIFGFGFSRGAFAIRSLAGFVQTVGLAERGIDAGEIDDLYRQYLYQDALLYGGADRHRLVQFQFLGLWDTVGALVGATAHNIRPSNVLNVAHALALDEQRDDFAPEYWCKRGEPASAPSIREVWFSGSHGNVGGGYVDDNLSNIAFFWVMNEARNAGLNLSLESMEWWIRENEGSVLRRESIRRLWKVVRIINVLAGAGKVPPQARKVADGHRVHESVVDRIRNQTLRPAYRPATAGPDPAFWAQIDDPRWQQTWLEPWGFQDQLSEQTAILKPAGSVMMEIPAGLTDHVEAMILEWAASHTSSSGPGPTQ